MSVASCLSMAALLLGLCAVVPTSCIHVTEESEVEPPLEKIHELFEHFQKKFQRSYANEIEHAMRFQHFQTNVQKMAELRAQNPHATFTLNEWSDVSREEFKRKRTGLIPGQQPAKASRATYMSEIDVRDYPTNVDWREHGAVNPVQDQEQCGSCWAFSIVAVTESQWFIKHNTLPKLSEQMVVSCDLQASGCRGAFPPQALDGLIHEYGGKVSLGSTYPYVSHLPYAPPCDPRMLSNGAVIHSYEVLPSDETVMLASVATKGPLAVVVDATPLQNYHSGIITQAMVDQTDHVVVIVGYGNTTSTNPPTPYWIVRNSWGPSWGENGYFRVIRDMNMLLIATSPIHIDVE